MRSNEIIILQIVTIILGLSHMVFGLFMVSILIGLAGVIIVIIAFFEAFLEDPDEVESK